MAVDVSREISLPLDLSKNLSDVYKPVSLSQSSEKQRYGKYQTTNVCFIF